MKAKSIWIKSKEKNRNIYDPFVFVSKPDVSVLENVLGR